MNITSSDLIKIADAGYHDKSDLFLNCISYGTVEIFENRIFRLIGYGQTAPNYILDIEVSSDNNVWIDTNNNKFDHIAAIKKMRDLGLIKID